MSKSIMQPTIRYTLQIVAYITIINYKKQARVSLEFRCKKIKSKKSND